MNERADFFVAGGTLRILTSSYVMRPADTELYESIWRGEFCYVLTPRQMGKSSLMIRTAVRLRADGFSTAIVDLSALGTRLTSEQWYLNIIKALTTNLALPISPEAWWQSRGTVNPVQRLTDFLRDVVLTEIPGHV